MRATEIDTVVLRELEPKDRSPMLLFHGVDAAGIGARNFPTLSQNKAKQLVNVSLRSHRTRDVH